MAKTNNDIDPEYLRQVAKRLTSIADEIDAGAAAKGSGSLVLDRHKQACPIESMGRVSYKAGESYRLTINADITIHGGRMI